MDSSVIAALIDVGSQWQSNLMNLGYNELNYWRSRRQEERLWEREDTAVQRRVEDLKKAGLNPLLAAGSPAASGMVSQHYGNPNFNINMGELMDVVKNNYEAIKDQQVAQVDLMLKDSAKKDAEIELINSQKAEADVKVLELMSSIESLNIKNRELAHNLSYYEKLGLPTNSPATVKTAGVFADKLDEIIDKSNTAKSEKEILEQISKEKKESIKKLKKENKNLKKKVQRSKFSNELFEEFKNISNLPFMDF